MWQNFFSKVTIQFLVLGEVAIVILTIGCYSKQFGLYASMLQYRCIQLEFFYELVVHSPMSSTTHVIGGLYLISRLTHFQIGCIVISVTLYLLQVCIIILLFLVFSTNNFLLIFDCFFLFTKSFSCKPSFLNSTLELGEQEGSLWDMCSSYHIFPVTTQSHIGNLTGRSWVYHLVPSTCKSPSPSTLG